MIRPGATYWRAIWSGWWLIALCGAIGLTCAYGIFSLLPRQYEVTALVRVDVPTDTNGVANPTTSATLLSTEAAVATSDDALTLAIGHVEGVTKEQMKASLRVAVVTGANLLQITASHPSLETAAQIAHSDALAIVEYETTRQQQQNTAREQPLRSQLGASQVKLNDIQRQLDQLKLLGVPATSPTMVAVLAQQVAESSTFAALTGQLVQLQYNEAAQQPGFSIAQDASPAHASLQPAPQRSLLIGGAVGLLCGVLLAAVRGRTVRLRRLDQARELAGDVILTQLPTSISATDIEHPTLKGDELSSAVAGLRLDLTFLRISHSATTFVVTGDIVGAGASTVAATLAEQWAKAGKRTLLVDAHISAPYQHTRYGLAPGPGLTEAAAEAQNGTLNLGAYLRPTSEPFLMLLPAGRQRNHESHFLASPTLGLVMDALRASDAEAIIIDAPPVRSAPGMVSLARRADATILVIDQPRARIARVEATLAALRSADAPLEAVVLNSPLRWSTPTRRHRDDVSDATQLVPAPRPARKPSKVKPPLPVRM